MYRKGKYNNAIEIVIAFLFLPLFLVLCSHFTYSSVSKVVGWQKVMGGERVRANCQHLQSAVGKNTMLIFMVSPLLL